MDHHAPTQHRAWRSALLCLILLAAGWVASPLSSRTRGTERFGASAAMELAEERGPARWNDGALPAAVVILSFDAAVQGEDVLLSWTTESEIDTLGFHLYRSLTLYGTRTKINPSLIPAQHPGQPLGDSYEYLDTTVEPSTTYYYWLMDEALSGARHVTGPAVVTTPEAPPTATSTNTPTATDTHTPTATWTHTPTATWTHTPVDTDTPTATWTHTPVDTDTPTATWTHTPVDTDTPTATWTHTPVDADTPTATATTAPNAQPETVSASPTTGYSAPGAVLTFSAIYRDPNGWADLRYVYLRLNTNDALTDCIYLRYDVETGELHIRQPDDSAWLGGGLAGSAGTVQTSHATLDYGLTTAAHAGDYLTVNWTFTPSYRMSGLEHNLYLLVEDRGGLSDGWDDHGNWTINRAPDYLIPPDLAGATLLSSPDPSAPNLYSLSARYRDLDGWPNQETLYLAFADGLPTTEMAPGGVFLKYEQGENRLYLADSAGASWGAGATPRSGAFLENEAARVSCAWSYPGVADLRTRLVYWRIEFKPAFQGPRQMYMRAKDAFWAQNGDTGWKLKGGIVITPP